MQSIILAGWNWTRLWPVSTDDNPKQFIEFEKGRSFIQMTAERLLKFQDKETIFVNTNEKYKWLVTSHLNKLWIDNLILEPSKRNTAPSIALVIKYLQDIKWFDDDEILFFCPSDHLISPIWIFIDTIKMWEKIAKNWNIVLFWIRPIKPEIWYWYIEIDYKTYECDLRNKINNWEEFWKTVRSFKEKPDFNTAKKYLSKWNYFWNSWMFMFSIACMKKEFEKYCPSIYEFMKKPFDEFISDYEMIESISVDYAIMEKTKKTKLLPMSLVWSDIWSWDSFFENTVEDISANVIIWNVICNNVKNSLIYNWSSKKIIVDNLDNMIYVSTDENTYITKRWNSENIKNLL